MFRSLGWVALACVGCGSPGDSKIDASSIDTPRVDTLMPDAVPLGSQANPALSCVALRTAGKPSGVYYLQDPVTNAAFETYCDQDRNGGGWTLVFRSVMTTAGTTTAFWDITYAKRFDVKGAAMPGTNYYAGTVYREGKQYMDTFTDLQGATAIAMVATATGFNASTMSFTGPAFTSGDMNVYTNQFASGWASGDHDADTAATVNCAAMYNNVTQHYSSCWTYNLGADAEAPTLDGGVGPHVFASSLTGLSLATDGSGYSRVNEIARYARW